MPDPARLAAALLAERDAGRQRAPLSETEAGFDLAAARAVAVEIRRLRIARGERLAGRKIGFTNRTIWDRYGVHAPIWGDVWDSTLHRLDGPTATVTLPALPEPRIEPEIAFGFASATAPDMDDAALVGCIAWAAHGFEVVTSPFPAWRFAAADCQAGFGLHGALYLGPPLAPAALGPDPAATLAGLRIALTDGDRTEHGRGTDVLDGPVAALRHLLRELSAAGEDPVAAGDVVTTGTLTDAQPMRPGDRWRTTLQGCPLPGLDLRFAA